MALAFVVKTTNLQRIYENIPRKEQKAKCSLLPPKQIEPCFFDFLPLDLGTIKGMKTKVQLYTCAWSGFFYDTTRKLVLKNADGVVFVADSNPSMRDSNVESFKNLIVNLKEMSFDLKNISPCRSQLNKRDVPKSNVTGKNG